MKNSISMVSALIKMMTRPAAENKSARMIFAENLPMKVKLFVTNYFPNRSIAFAEMKTSSNGMTYMITLNDGIEIRFSENGACEMVDCGMGIPAALVPVYVEAFVSTFHPGPSIIKIEKIANGYEVTLSNYVVLKINDIENVA